MIVGCLLIWALAAASEPAPSRPDQDRASSRPEYDPQGNLLRPQGFEQWIVVGTSVGLSYSDGQAKPQDNPGMFHNVYLPPDAFEHFVKTGEFPEQTIFVVTNNPSQLAAQEGLGRQGFFAADSRGLEVAVKDSRRFEGGWGYFMYHGEPTPNPPNRDSAKAFARAECFDCHAEHGATDNVFTQFYSVLKGARAKHLAKTP